MLGELNVRGQVKFRKGNIAYIKADNQKVTYSFNKGATIDVPFDEFQEYDYVDFYGTNYDGRLRANYVRKSGLEWQKGVIVELNDDKDAYCRIKSEGGRIFWFKERCLCAGERKEEFAVGDTVKFQCQGYYGRSGNQALMVTKKRIGYIISYDEKMKKGIIDFDLPFSIMNVNNPLDYYLDTERNFYYVSYEFDNENECAVDITVLAERKDIIFDESKKWIDGTVTKVVANQKYCIISPMQNPKNTFHVGVENLGKYCDFIYMREGQQVSFLLEDEPIPQRVSWTGYITRFPTNPVSKDLSGRINVYLKKYEPERLYPKPDLLYFFKNKIINSTHNDAFTRYWVTTELCGEEKKIPISTAHTNLRYKVRFAYTEDSVYGVRAIHISVIGVEKAPVISTNLDQCEIIRNMTTEQDEKDTQNVQVINNFYSPLYAPTIIGDELQKVEDFLNLVKTDTFSTYIEHIWKKTISVFKIYPDEMGNCRLLDNREEAINYFGDKIVPVDQFLKDDEGNKKLDIHFGMIKDKVFPSVSDKLLSALSPRCKLYVESASIIEYELKDVSLWDFSALIVTYGKALEQELRDKLYRIIQNSGSLKVLKDRNQKEIVSIEMEKTTIGNYIAYIDNNIQMLPDITKSILEIQGYTEKDFGESEWWIELSEKLKAAGDIRNRSDHAGVSVLKAADLQKMKELLLGNKGIFESLNGLFAVIEGCENFTVESCSEYFLENTRVEFTGEYMKENYLIVGKLTSGERAALHIDQVAEQHTTYDEFVDIFEKSKQKIEVRMLKHTSKGYQVSLKNL